MNQELNFIAHTLEKSTERGISRKEEVKRILEGLLFSSSEPIAFEKLREIVTTTYPLRPIELKALIEELKGEYQHQKRGFQIDEIADGYLLRTVEDVHPYIELLHQNKRGEKLSKAATEVLAIIAYKQPITRAEVDKIRGVDCSGTVAALLERGLIEGVGRLEAPGRPLQYGTTRRFLQHFGMKTLDDLLKLIKA